jgi:gluconate 5-dehydrogenase
MSYLNLKNKVTIISGGYGHLGAPICNDLSSLGSRVYCFGRDIKKFKSTFQFSLKNKKKIFFVKCDVTKEKQVVKAVNIVIKKEKKIDILVNNAINSQFRSISSNIKLNEWNNNLTQVIQGYFLLSKHCIEFMKKKRSGRIINVASLFGTLAPIKKMHLDLKNEPPISMVVGKGGIIQFTKYLASILGEFNILVNTVSPGWFPKKNINKVERKDYLKEMESRIPLNRIGKPTEISGVICFLASEKSSYITGQNYIVDGGYSIW